MELPSHLVEARRTPLFDHESLPEALAKTHRTTVWGTLHVQQGSVQYTESEGESPRSERLDPGDHVAIPPFVAHEVDPSTDATFFVQFYREPGADLVPLPESAPPAAIYRDAPWEHRGCDLDAPAEIFELVTRQYSDIVQDDLLATYFAFGTDAMDWRAHILRIADYWNHVLLFAPSYETDIIGRHQAIHEDGEPFSADAFDRWLQVFLDAVDGGWTGPNAEIAKKRATGTAWAMAQRVLGKGVWRPSVP